MPGRTRSVAWASGLLSVTLARARAILSARSRYLKHDQAVASAALEAEVSGRFGMLPNFFQSAAAAPELVRQLWGFAKAGYLDNPMPSVFKERLFVWLSRFCPTRYCIVRHVGFLLVMSTGSPRVMLPQCRNQSRSLSISCVDRRLGIATCTRRRKLRAARRLAGLRSNRALLDDAASGDRDVR